MTANPFDANNKDWLSMPACSVRAIVPSDTVGLPNGVCRAICVGSGGNADFIDAGGNLCEGYPLQTGYNPIGVARINATNLVASNIWALY
jgi:hypothetical protein